MFERMHEHATANYDLIMHTREWNFSYGGVYVVKQGGVPTPICTEWGLIQMCGMWRDVS
jgi:hypothetical protein